MEGLFSTQSHVQHTNNNNKVRSKLWGSENETSHIKKVLSLTSLSLAEILKEKKMELLSSLGKTAFAHGNEIYMIEQKATKLTSG